MKKWLVWTVIVAILAILIYWGFSFFYKVSNTNGLNDPNNTAPPGFVANIFNQLRAAGT